MPGLPEIKSLWDFQDPAGTERKFRDLLPAAKSDPGYYVELLTQIARTYSLRSKFDEAHAQLDEAEGMLGPEMHQARVRYLLERGRAFNSSGEAGVAMPLFESAFRLGSDHHLEFLAVDAAHMIAIAHPEPAQQLQWNLQTIAYVEASSDGSVQSWLGTLYNNAGWTYHASGDYKTALEFLQKARAHYDRSGNSKTRFIARWAVAKLLRLNGDIGQAMEIQTALEADMTAKNDPDGFVYEELGELHQAQNNVPNARDYFRRAIPLLEKVDWFVKSEPARLARIKSFADC